MTALLYLIGALRNPQVSVVGSKLRQIGFDVFDDWYSPGPEADLFWQRHQESKGVGYKEALYSHFAQHIWEFDKHYLDRADLGVMLHPVGRSAHIELGYLAGRGKPTFILFDKEPEKWDIMARFATNIYFSFEDMVEGIIGYALE